MAGFFLPPDGDDGDAKDNPWTTDATSDPIAAEAYATRLGVHPPGLDPSLALLTPATANDAQGAAAETDAVRLIDAWGTVWAFGAAAVVPPIATAVIGAASAGAAPGAPAHPAGSPIPSQTADGGFATNAIYGETDPFDATPLGVREALAATGLSVTGAGIMVGVISDSFNDLGGAPSDEAKGLLAKVDVLADLPSGGDDEGRAMLQIVHDIAPGASEAFYSGTLDLSPQGYDTAQNDLDFANGILALANAGCKVICDDIVLQDQPWFQSGVVAQAIATVEQEGVVYVACAGNQGLPAYQSAWSQTTLTYQGKNYDALNFGTSNSPTPFQNVTYTAGAQGYLELQWNQPWGDATSNIEVDIWFNNGIGEELFGSYTRSSDPVADEQSDPVVIVPFDNNSASTLSEQISIVDLSGPNPGTIKYIAYDNVGGTSVTISGYPNGPVEENTGTVIGQHESPAAIAVGAVDAGNTPGVSGTSSPISEPFSSSGLNTEYLLAANGSPLASPEQLPGVAVSGVDDISTSVPGSLSDFFGTSAATPSVAAVAALLLQANPRLTPTGVDLILEASAIPTDSTNGTADPAVGGSGLVQANSAVSLAETTPPPVVGGAGNTADYTGGGAAAYVDSGLTVSDAFTTSLLDATVSIGAGSFLTGDILSATTTATTITASYAAATGVLTLSGSDTLAQYQAVLDSVSYSSTSANPTNSGADPSRAIGWVVSDPVQSSAPMTSTVDVAASLAESDFYGNGHSDLLWRNSSGEPFIYEMNGTAVVTSGSLANPGPGWRVIGTGDFYDNGYSDILWQNTGGAVAIWKLNGTAMIGGGSLGNPGPSWHVVGAGDFYDNGYSDILWQNSNGAVVIWEMNGTSVIGGGSVGNPGPSWHPVATGDFYDNGYSDILWQNSTGAGDIWEMNGTNVVGGGTLGDPGPSWHIVGTGDFYDSGYSDILWQNDNGAVVVWEMNGTNVIGGGSVGNPGTSWHVIGTGDYYGNGYSDILLQNSSGAVDIWQMDGTNVVGGGSVGNPGPSWHVTGASAPFIAASADLLGQSDSGNSILFQNDSGAAYIWQTNGAAVTGGGTLGNPGPSWHIKAEGDFYGNGDPDVLWQNDNGAAYIWETNGTSVIGGGSLGNPGTSWHIVGAGDFNDDGRADILWQNDNGAGAIWEMNGTNVIGGGSLGNPGPTWHIKGTGDFNHDGYADILWQNDSGEAYIWEMNGTNVIGGGSLGNPGPTWHVKGSGDFFGNGLSDIVWQNDSGAVVLWEMNGINVIGGGSVGNPGPSWHVMGTGNYSGAGQNDILFQNSSGAVAVWEVSGTSIIGGGSLADPGPTWHV